MDHIAIVTKLLLREVERLESTLTATDKALAEASEALDAAGEKYRALDAARAQTATELAAIRAELINRDPESVGLMLPKAIIPMPESVARADA